MGRRILVISLGLTALGVLLNLAVAWTCALLADFRIDPFEPLRIRSEDYPGPAGLGYLYSRLDRVGATRGYLTPDLGWGGEWDPLESASMRDVVPSWATTVLPGLQETSSRVEIELTIDEAIEVDQHQFDVRFIDSCGWPCRALGGIAQSGRTARIGTYCAAVWKTPRVASQGVRMLPLRPLWSGFAINTMCYAVVALLAISGPLAVRRLIRRRRGLCPKCGYPMGNSGCCTECGAVRAAVT